MIALNARVDKQSVKLHKIKEYLRKHKDVTTPNGKDFKQQAVHKSIEKQQNEDESIEID